MLLHIVLVVLMLACIASNLLTLSIGVRHISTVLTLISAIGIVVCAVAEVANIQVIGDLL